MPSLSRFHFLLNNAVFLLLLASCLLVEANNPYGPPPPAPYKQNPGHYGNYGQYYSGDSSSNAGVPVQYQKDEGGQRRRVNANAIPRRMSLQQPPPAQQYPQKKFDSGMFTDPDFCAEKCELPCQQQLFFSRRDTDAEPGFYCAKIRPPPKAFHEKITDGIGNAGIFEFIVAGVILFAILLCLICTCYQCCCRRPMGSRHRGRSFGSSEEADQAGPVGKVGGPHSLNGGGTLSSGLSPEHESLTNNHMDDGIHPAPLPLPTKVGLNGGAGLSAHGQPLKSSHNNNINSQHQFLPRSSTGGAFSSTGSREQSIV